MAFICPPKEDVERRRKLLCQLKSLVNDMDCAVQCKVCCPARCCVPCPSACDMPATVSSCGPCPPNAMVCYRVADKDVVSSKAKPKDADKPKAGGDDKGGKTLKTCKSRELRCGNLYTGCHCEKRNGLQDDCPRNECHGSPECLTKPPTCCPSEFCDAKHLLNKKKEKHGGESGGGGAASGEGKSKKDAGASHKYQCFPAYVAPECLCLCPTIGC